MKNDQLITTRRNQFKNLFEQTLYTDCKQEFVKVVSAHYAHSAYINAWGGLFTTNTLRPELNINYSNIIAECFNMPEDANAIYSILADNYPNGLIPFKKSVEVSLDLIVEHCISKGWKRTVQFNREIISKLIASACAINKVFTGIESMHLGDTRGCFEKTSTIETKMRTDYLLEIVLSAMGGSIHIEDQANYTYLLDAPFTSADPTKEINKRIDYLQKTIQRTIPE
jgi:hypothetical protein